MKRRIEVLPTYFGLSTREAFVVRYLPLLILCLYAPSLAAQDKIVHGAIRTLDLEVGTITIQTDLKNPPKTLSLAKKELPFTDPLGNALKLSDLAVHQRVSVTLSGNEEDVTAIRLESYLEWGRLMAVFPDTKKIDVRLTAGIPRQITLGAETKCFLDLKPVELKEMKLSSSFYMVLSPDRKTVLQLHQATAGVPVLYGSRTTRVSGLLLDVDHKKRTAKVCALKDRYEIHEVTFDGWSDMTLIHQGKNIRAIDGDALHPRTQVVVLYEADTMRILELKAQAPGFERKLVEAIDVDKLQIVIVKDEVTKENETFRLAPNAVVLKSSKPIPIAEIRAGDSVSVGLSLDQKEIQYLYKHSK